MNVNGNSTSNFFQKVYKIVKKIPKGKVATYGQVAGLCGHPRGARTVGWALHILDEEGAIPWQRVINREGRISTTCLEHTADLQRFLLINEGVKVVEKDGNFWIDLKKYLWQPRGYYNIGRQTDQSVFPKDRNV